MGVGKLIDVLRVKLLANTRDSAGFIHVRNI